MASTLYKDAGAGSGSDTTLTIRTFYGFNFEIDTPSEAFADIAGDEDDTILVAMMGTTMKISFDWDVHEEASDVIAAGIGGPVTTAIGQVKYLIDTLKSSGTSAILDSYTVTLDFGGGVTIVKTGKLTKLTVNQTSDAPITYKAHAEITVGTVT